MPLPGFFLTGMDVACALLRGPPGPPPHQDPRKTPLAPGLLRCPPTLPFAIQHPPNHSSDINLRSDEPNPFLITVYSEWQKLARVSGREESFTPPFNWKSYSRLNLGPSA